MYRGIRQEEGKKEDGVKKKKRKRDNVLKRGKEYRG